MEDELAVVTEVAGAFVTITIGFPKKLLDPVVTLPEVDTFV